MQRCSSCHAFGRDHDVQYLLQRQFPGSCLLPSSTHLGKQFESPSSVNLPGWTPSLCRLLRRRLASGIGLQPPRPHPQTSAAQAPSTALCLVPSALSFSSSQTTDSSKLRSATNSQEHAGQVVNREKIMCWRGSEAAARFILLGKVRRGPPACRVGLA